MTQQAADFQTAAWKRFVAAQEVRLAELREQNDSLANDPIKTAAIRGRIDEVKRVLSLSAADSPSPELHPALRGDGA